MAFHGGAGDPLDDALKMPLYTDEELAYNLSVKQGVDADAEAACRRAYTGLIWDVCQKLLIPPWAAATATFYCHHFFAVRSILTNDVLAVAIAALYLACKVDEVSGSGAISAPDAASTEVATPQSAHDQQGASNTICQPGAGEDPFPERDRGSLRLLLKQALACDATMRSGDGGTDCDAAQARDEKAMRDHVLTAERLIMLETGFRLPAYHLHGDVAAMCAALEWDEPRTQCAWNITNDSLITLIGIQFPVRAVAWAVVHCVASAFSELTMLERADPEFPGVPVYIWELEGFSADTVNEVAARLRALYSRTSAPGAEDDEASE